MASKKRTIADRLCDALERSGHQRSIGEKTKKYVVYSGGSLKGNDRWYVGKSGALRIGPTIGRSISAPNTRAKLLAEVPE